MKAEEQEKMWQEDQLRELARLQQRASELAGELKQLADKLGNIRRELEAVWEVRLVALKLPSGRKVGMFLPKTESGRRAAEKTR
jgi:uncharacterized protein YlxW (UPF0749 family)